MKPSTAITWLWLRLRYGPRGDTPGRVIGLLLWWRTWTLAGILVAPYAAGLLAQAYFDPPLGVAVTWLAAAILFPHAMSVSPKYDVDRNY